MPPKKADAKAKAKAKAKGQAKSKAKSKPKAKAKEKADAVDEAQPLVSSTISEDAPDHAAPAAVPKPKSAALKKKLAEELTSKSLDDAIAEATASVELADAKIAETSALEEKHAADMEAARKDFELAKGVVEEAVSDEVEAAQRWRTCREKKEHQSRFIAEHNSKAFELQKKIAALDMMSVQMQRCQDAGARKLAVAQAEKERLAEQRLREKEAVEETRRQIAEKTKAGDNKRKIVDAAADMRLTSSKASKASAAAFHDQATLPYSAADGEGEDVN